MNARLAVFIFVIPFVVISLTSCKNAFSEFANKNTDEALLFEANRLADSRNWTEAIAKVGEMSAAGRAKRGTKYALASFYAGRCGLDLLQLSSDIATGLGVGTNLMPVLSTAMSGAVIAEADDCEAAEVLIQSISTVPTDRTADENVFLAMLEFAKIGAVLVSSGVDANGDGTIDTDHAATCAITAIPVGQTYSPAQRLGAGIMNAVASLEASGSTIGAAATAAMTPACTTIEGTYAGFCSQYLPADFAGTEDDAVAAFVLSSEIGYNLCGGTITTGTCVCP